LSRRETEGTTDLIWSGMMITSCQWILRERVWYEDVRWILI